MARNPSQRSFPRAERLSSLFAEILAEEIERIAYIDDRVFLITLTGVEVDPDIRHATIFFNSLTDEQYELLDEYKARLKSAIASKTRLKRIPQLKFVVDPAIEGGNKIDTVLQKIVIRDEIVVDKENYKNL